ncbi:hypothetical protein GRI38_11820 [Altererythrobacter aurantiacus]|uniref:Uncharacterized protein n=1 Tax=Parapontixanthobacter aurantiacus TaxID=1463599 RepID=A0A844ZH47_9SPHN|nr:hypothetical protein [Parapontixanthobacter aurantiacus]MXO86713.1 hypothetical protein [Parapontixanthobacter aurantiacus]
MTKDGTSLIAHRGFPATLALWFATLFSGLAAVVPSSYNAAFLAQIGLRALTRGGAETGIAGRILCIIIGLVVGIALGLLLARFLRWRRRKKMQRYSFDPIPQSEFGVNVSRETYTEDAEYEDVVSVEEITEEYEDDPLVAPDFAEAEDAIFDLSEEAEGEIEPEPTPGPAIATVPLDHSDAAPSEAEQGTNEPSISVSYGGEATNQPAADAATHKDGQDTLNDVEPDASDADAESSDADVAPPTDTLPEDPSDPADESDATPPDPEPAPEPAQEEPAPEEPDRDVGPPTSFAKFVDTDAIPSETIRHPLKEDGSLESLLQRLDAAKREVAPPDRPERPASAPPSPPPSPAPSPTPSQTSNMAAGDEPVLSDRLRAAIERLEEARRKK